jgi:hypothetical protein
MTKTVDERISEMWKRIYTVVKRHKKDSGEDVCTAISPMLTVIVSLEKEKHQVLEADNTRLRQWVNDLQSGMYVNCVYCGHRYGPDKETPVAMADILKAHIEQCPEHPLSKAKVEIANLRACLLEITEWMESHDINEFDEEDHPLETANRLLGRKGK